MKKMLMLGAFALGAVAAAQTAEPTTLTCPVDLCVEGPDSYVIGETTASASEGLAVIIPKRVGLHLHENFWSVDLTNLKNNDCKCYRAGNHSSTTGLDEVYDLVDIFAKADFWGDGKVQADNPYSSIGRLNFNDARILEVNRYPGFETNSTGKLLWKGPIMCVNQKVVEKFSNAKNGFKFTAELKNATAGFPSFLMADRLSGNGGTKVAWLRQGGEGKGPQTMAEVSAAQRNTYRGWVDDHILEAMVFDGYEQPGVQSAYVLFKITGNF